MGPNIFIVLTPPPSHTHTKMIILPSLTVYFDGKKYLATTVCEREREMFIVRCCDGLGLFVTLGIGVTSQN